MSENTDTGKLMKHCLKCGADSEVFDIPLAECPQCGAIYSRVEEAFARKAAEDAERKAMREAHVQRVAIANKATAERNQALVARFIPGNKSENRGVLEPIAPAALIECPACQKSVSSLAPSCPHCGHPLLRTVKYAGPPKSCPHCGNALRKEAKRTDSGSGCLIILVGLLFSPLLIGIPVLIYGIHLMGRREGQWRCVKCEAVFPRRIRWFEFT